MSPGPPRNVILFVDDFEDALQAFRGFVRYDFHPVTFSAASQATAGIDELRAMPDGAMIDVFLRDGTGFDVARHLRQRFGTRLPILMVTGKHCHGWIENEANELGVTIADKADLIQQKRFLVGIATSSINAPRLRDCVLMVCMEKAFPPRDARILSALVTGSTRATLAGDLGISEDTLKSRLALIMGKLEVPNTEAIAAAILQRANAMAT